jgi:hypothetical protein
MEFFYFKTFIFSFVSLVVFFTRIA